MPRTDALAGSLSCSNQYNSFGPPAASDGGFAGQAAGAMGRDYRKSKRSKSSVPPRSAPFMSSTDPTPRGNWHVLANNKLDKSLLAQNPADRRLKTAQQTADDFKNAIAHKGQHPSSASKEAGRDMHYQEMGGNRLPSGVKFQHVRLSQEHRAFFLEGQFSNGSGQRSSRGSGSRDEVGFVKFLQLGQHDYSGSVEQEARTFQQESESAFQVLKGRK